MLRTCKIFLKKVLSKVAGFGFKTDIVGYNVWRRKEMKILPLFDRVVIEPEQKNNASNSGLVLPDIAKVRQEEGVVVAVADGTNFEGEKVEMKVKIGDKVFFNKYAGAEVKIENKTYIVMRQIDIIGVIND